MLECPSTLGIFLRIVFRIGLKFFAEILVEIDQCDLMLLTKFKFFHKKLLIISSETSCRTELMCMCMPVVFFKQKNAFFCVFTCSNHFA